MTKTILSKRYAECWICEKLDIIFEFGNKDYNFGREWLCSDCLERVKKQGYFNKKVSVDKSL